MAERVTSKTFAAEEAQIVFDPVPEKISNQSSETKPKNIHLKGKISFNCHQTKIKQRNRITSALNNKSVMHSANNKKQMIWDFVF